MENITYTGSIIWFNVKKGYGFIDWSIDNVKQKDLFIHFSDLSMTGFKTINAGQKISFELGTNKNGIPKAINVLAIKDQ